MRSKATPVLMPRLRKLTLYLTFCKINPCQRLDSLSPTRNDIPNSVLRDAQMLLSNISYISGQSFYKSTVPTLELYQEETS